MRSFLGVPVLVRGEAWGNLYLTEKEGGPFDEADEEAIVVLARWAATAIQNAHLYRNEQAQRAELERAVRALETTSAITRALGTETDLDRVLELIVKRGRALVEATSMVLLLAEGDELVGRAAAGEVDASVLGLKVPVEDSVVGHVFRTGRTERLSEIKSQVRFRLGEHLHASTGLVVPLVFRSRRVGVLAALRPARRRAGVRDGGRAADGGVRGGSRDGRGGCRRTWPPRPASAASRRPRASAPAGRASCTTRRCRSSAA